MWDLGGRKTWQKAQRNFISVSDVSLRPSPFPRRHLDGGFQSCERYTGFLSGFLMGEFGSGDFDAAAGVLLEGGDKGIALLRTTRASSMVDPGTIGLIKGSGMQANDPVREVPEDQRWFMAGPPVAVGATRILVDEIRRVQGDGHTIDWLIPHQANLTRILIPACKSAGIDPKRLCASFAETGNTSSASIPLLLDQLVRDGRTVKGENALLIGFGASFSVGSALLTFQ